MLLCVGAYAIGWDLSVGNDVATSRELQYYAIDTADDAHQEQTLRDVIRRDMVACRLSNYGASESPLRLRRSITEGGVNHLSVTYISVLNIAGVGAHHLLNQKILNSSLLRIGLPRVEIIFPFHSFW